MLAPSKALPLILRFKAYGVLESYQTLSWHNSGSDNTFEIVMSLRMRVAKQALNSAGAFSGA